MSQRNILISRMRGGLGDVICCEVAVSATRQRYPLAHITLSLTDPYFGLMWDQKRSRNKDTGADEVVWPDSRDVLSSIITQFDLHLELDGPELRHQLETNYHLTESRIESWCKYVDCLPTD